MRRFKPESDLIKFDAISEAKKKRLAKKHKINVSESCNIVKWLLKSIQTCTGFTLKLDYTLKLEDPSS